MAKRTKINHAARNKAARLEWDKLAKQAHELGLSKIVRRYQPCSIDAWATIEKANDVLRWHIEENQSKEDNQDV